MNANANPTGLLRAGRVLGVVLLLIGVAAPAPAASKKAPTERGPTKNVNSAACSDHLDNDGDGLCDFAWRNAYCLDGSQAGDPDCSSKNDDTESCVPVEEVCDGLDNDCDKLVDEGDVCWTEYFCDQDADSYLASEPSGSCSGSACIPTGCSVLRGPDCNDSDAGINPGRTESCDFDGLDNDCDGVVDECDHCMNGVQDGDESDIDCGGSCAPCQAGGLCNGNLDCASGTCDGGVCIVPPVNLDPSCRPLKFDSGALADRVNLVFVPSGFDGDMNAFAWEVSRIASIFASYEPFGPTSPDYNVLYVPEEAGSYCNFNCNGIARLLCCSTSLARSLSSTCTTGARQTIVVHNSTTYGGAGYTSSDVATTSIHSSAPRIAIHELGHSLFSLADEYNYSTSLVSGAPNCDVSACPNWADMIGYNGVDCRSGSCANGGYWTSESTLMRSLSYPFEEVNLRSTCCTYFRDTGSFPGYCSQFEQFAFSSDLVAYCGGDSGASPSAAPGAVERLEAPEELEFVLQGSGEWQLVAVTERPPGLYPRGRIHGDGAGPIEVEIQMATGARRRLAFLDSAPVEYPGETSGMGGYTSVPRESLSVLNDRQKHGRPVGVRVSRRSGK